MAVTLAGARAVLEEARAIRAFPAAVCEVGCSDGPIWIESFGQLTYSADSPATSTSTPFDLASLTKVIATTSVVMNMVRQGVLRIDTPVSSIFSGWRGPDREPVTIGHLLDHSAGLPAQLNLSPGPHPKDAALQSILSVPLDRPVGTSSVYSDVGFMLLGFALEVAAGRGLNSLWDELWASRPDSPTLAARLAYGTDAALREMVAPTEVSESRGGLIQGVVHDENAAILGGVAAHAGLFGTASAVGTFAAWVLRSFRGETWLASPEIMRTFATPRTVPGSCRALGWDTMRPTSSCGTRMTPSAIGHTGFTGTSLWIDWERNLYAVLLTNRVHPTRQNERFLPYRARFHNAVWAELSA